MKHEEYKRIISDADTAVLFIHGILGSPNHFRDFLPLIPENWSVHNLLLDGHGKTVEAFSASSMKKWQIQVGQALNSLRIKHKNIIIVGHSMGTLLAIRQAVKNPSRIRALLLLAVPLSLRISSKAAKQSLKVVFEQTDDNDVWELAAKDTYSLTPDRRLWKYPAWLPRYLELFGEIGTTRKTLSRVSAPVYAFQSLLDELVDISSVEILSKNKNIRCSVLQNSGHNYYSPDDKAIFLQTFKDICNEILNK